MKQPKDISDIFSEMFGMTDNPFKQTIKPPKPEASYYERFYYEETDTAFTLVFNVPGTTKETLKRQIAHRKEASTGTNWLEINVDGALGYSCGVRLNVKDLHLPSGQKLKNDLENGQYKIYLSKRTPTKETELEFEGL